MSYPVLYDANATDFFSLGIGLLDEAKHVRVIEERNGPFYLEMEYPVMGKQFSNLQKSNIIKSNAGPELSDQRFRISQISKVSEEWTVTIYAEHVSYMAQDLAMKPIVHILTLNCQEALTVWKSAILDVNPFTVSSDITTVASTDWHIRDVQNPRMALGGVQGSLLDKYGGEYKFDNYHISLLKQRGKRANTMVSYGRNIIDIQQEENITNTFTSVYPYATYEDENGIDKIVTIDGYVVDSEYLDNYPHRKVLPIDFSGEFEIGEIPTKAKLEKLGEDFVKNNNVGVPNISIKLTYLDLAQTLDYKESAANEIVNLCDELPVNFELLGIETTSKVVRVVWDGLLDRYDSVELGQTRTNLSTVISNIEKQVNQVQSTINEVQVAANGKNMIFRGPDTPIAQNVGDSWYKPNGDDVELYIWDGATWEFIMSTKPDPKIQEAIDEAKEEAKQAQEDADSAMAKADESNAKAIQAVSEAGFAKDQANQAQILANSVNNQLPAIKADAKAALDAFNNLDMNALNLFMGFPNNDVLHVTKTNYFWDYPFGANKTLIPLKPNTEYILTWDYKHISGDIGNMSIGYADDTGKFIIDRGQVPATAKQYKFTTGPTLAAPNLGLRFNRTGTPSGSITDYWDLAFREGNTNLGWSANPQDVQVQIININGELSRKVTQTQFDLLQGTVSNQGTQINQNKNDIALKANTSTVNTLTGRVTAAESALNVQSGKIEGLVTKTDGQGVEIGQLKVQSNSIQLQVSALPDYIQSRGQNLVTNGMGSLGTNRNFATMVFDGSERAIGVGSFKSSVGGSGHFTDEFIPFDSRRIYEFSYFAKSLNGTGRFYACLTPYDVDRKQISVYSLGGKGFADVTTPTKVTKLTRPLKVGDTEIYVEDASLFMNTGSAVDHRHSVILWGYKNSKGYLYPTGQYSQFIFTNAWNAGDVNVGEKKISLRKPFNVTNTNATDGIFPVGYEISATSSGGTYIYPTNAINILLPKKWTEYKSKMTGIANYSTSLLNTQYVIDIVGYFKLGWLMNREVADTTWVNGITFSDVTEATDNSLSIASLEVKANGIQATVATKAEQTQVTQLANQWTQTTKLANEHTGQIANLGNQITLEINTLTNNKADKTQITLLQDQLNLKVQKGDTISQINLEAGKTLIQTNSLILSAATVTFTGSAFIPAASIVSLNAEKINTGILNAANVKVINMDAANITTGYLNANRIAAGSITADKLAANAIQVGINAMGNTIKISPTNLTFYEAGVLACSINDSGLRFWEGALEIGGIGEEYLEFSPGIRGISSRLEFSGSYLSWGYKLRSNDSSYTMLMYIDPRGKLSDYMGMHVDQDLYMNRNIGVKNAVQALKFNANYIDGVPYPGLLAETRRAGITFGEDELYLIQNNSYTRMSDIARVVRKLANIGAVQIPTSIRTTDGTVATWKNINFST